MDKDTIVEAKSKIEDILGHINAVSLNLLINVNKESTNFQRVPSMY